MINEVTLEGIIVKAWKYTDDLLFRVAIYRDPDLPQKASATDVHDAADYITIRVVKGSLGAPVSVEKGQHIRARLSAKPGLRRNPGRFPERRPWGRDEAPGGH